MSFTWIRIDQWRQGAGWDRLGGRLPPHPPWVLKWAVVAAAVVFFIPLAILALAALLVFLLVFGVMGLVARALGWLGGLGKSSSDDGRRNVRVIHDPARDLPGAQ